MTARQNRLAAKKKKKKKKEVRKISWAVFVKRISNFLFIDTRATAIGQCFSPFIFPAKFKKLVNNSEIPEAIVTVSKQIGQIIELIFFKLF